MKKMKTYSDIGGVLVGTKEFAVNLHNGIGDGTTTCIILDDKEEPPKYAKYNTMIKGTFNIYSYDCSNMKDEDIVVTLSGEYAVYYYEYEVYFEKLK